MSMAFKDGVVTIDGKPAPGHRIELRHAELDVPVAADTYVMRATIRLVEGLDAFKRELRALELREIARLAEQARHQGRLMFTWGPFLRFAWADGLPPWLQGPNARLMQRAELAYRARRLRRIPIRVGTYPILPCARMWTRRTKVLP